MIRRTSGSVCIMKIKGDQLLDRWITIMRIFVMNLKAECLSNRGDVKANFVTDKQNTTIT